MQLIATVRGILDQQRVELIVCEIRTSATLLTVVSVVVWFLLDGDKAVGCTIG